MADVAPLGELLAKHPAVLAVLHKHGVNFCSGCFITLFSPPEKAAAYHAVPDGEAFLRDLRSAMARESASPPMSHVTSEP